MTLEALEEGKEISDNFQNTVNFFLSIIFFVFYIESFFCRAPNEAKNSIHRNRYNKQTIDPMIRRVSICYVLVYAIRYTFFIIMWAGYNNEEFEILEYGVFDLGFSIGHALFYLLMILRLQKDLKKLTYKLGKAQLIVLYTLLALIFITDEFYFIVRHNRKSGSSILS